MLTCYAVDDEPLALQTVCEFIAQTPGLTLAGKFSSALQVLRALQQAEQPVDVLFLDIQMPNLNGLELARVLASRGGAPGPRVVFTTAYSQFALESYQVEALDYLVKPFDYEDFLRAVHKAQAYYQLLRRPVPAPPPATPPAAPAGDYLYVKADYQLVRVVLDDITLIEGLDDYASIHRRSDARPLLTLTTLKALEEKLPAQRFMRVHRSYIVGLNHISSVGRGTIQIGEQSIPVSERYRAAFDAYLDRWR
ncbi:LytR/AlgR family response regulator transcription factor [Hymenobacter oligotrophus]|nr:LytTR family DNA-binding domain-containing protein [Hymenobacter oligotrophus]